jgi:hypothetical protein
VRAALDDLAAFEHQDLIRAPIVDSRCAITNVVRPRAATAAVLDHRLALAVEARRRFVEQQDRGFARIARAIATRCRWPPDSLTPRSPTIVS